MIEGRKKKFITELAQKPRLRRESGLFLLDGPKMCAELCPDETEEVLVTRGFLQSGYAESCLPLLSHVGYTEVTDAEMKQMSDTVTPQGILAVVRQRKTKGLGGLLQGSAEIPFLLLLETIQDPGNLGTILRAAEAAGVTGIVMNRTCVDVYAPKVVRSTMGAILRVPFLVTDDLIETAHALHAREEEFRLYAAHLAGAVPYDHVDYCGACAIMIGNESRGLSDALTETADQAVKIPMCGKTESLNAAMAAAILSFEASRQRRNFREP